MKSPLLFTTLLSGLLTFSTTSTSADTMQGLKDKGWASYYAGFQGSGMEIGVDTEGEVEFYFTPRKNDRLNRAWPIETTIRIERRDKGEEKWVRKTIQRDGFTPMEKVEMNQEKVEYIATVTGGAQFKVMLTFDKSGVNIHSEMVGKPADIDKADYRVILESQMPSLMEGSSKYSEKELKKKMRGDELAIEFKEEKAQKLDIFEVGDAKKITAAHPASIMLKADKIGRKTLTWSLLDRKDKGALELEFKSTSKRALDGFDVSVMLVDEKGEQLAKGIRIDYK